MSKPGAFGGPGGLTVVATGTVDGETAVASYSHGGPVASSLITLTPSGGNPPYVGEWFYISGDRRIMLNLPVNDIAFQQWQASPRAFDSFTATWGWKVTDARGRTATGKVLVIFQSTS